MSRIAHTIKEKSRTDDVIITDNVDFSSLLLSKSVSQGLTNSGFYKPSPIQLKAIPLGRCGLDLIVQAKSGTGKTCVFAVVALETIQIDSPSLQVLVLAPTREIAIQIWEVISGIGSSMSGLKCNTFIGGLPLQEDRMKLKKTHIAIGTPGRVKQLIESGVMKTESIRLFVLDEADKLLEESFQDQINWIYSSLPENKQMLALSATYPEYLADHLTAYMRNPTFLRLNISDPALLGIRQYYKTVPYHPMSHVVFEAKSKALTTLLSSVSFQQCLVFSNLQTRAQNLADSLNQKGWPTACIAGCLDQKDRNHAMAKLKTYKCRILISTDLTARGIDADKVNMVINLDIPKDHETYLHRIGRAGRFGSFGIAVTLVSDGQEKMDLNLIEKRCNTHIHQLPDPIPQDLAHASAPIHLDDVVSAEVINTDRHTNGHTYMSDKNNSNRKDKTGSEKELGSAESSNSRIIKRQQNKHATHVIPSCDEDNFIEASKLGKGDDANIEEVESGSTGLFGNKNLNHHLVNGISSDSKMGTLETEFEPKESQIEGKYDIATKTIAETETASLLHSEAGLIDNSETAKVDNDLNDLQQITETVMENLVIDVLIDNCISGMVTRNSYEMASETEYPGDDKVEYSKSQIPNMFNTAPKQMNDELNDKDSEHPNAVKTNKAKHQSFNSKKRQQREKKSASKQNTALKISQFIKDKAAKEQSEPPPKTNKTEFDYKTQFASYKPPKLDIVSMFKQTIGHKSLTNFHTYDSAKSKLEANKPYVSDVSEKHTFIPKVERSEDHDALVNAVHELQRMFDRASIRPICVKNEVNSPDNITAGIIEDAGDKDRATKLEKADANSVEPQSEMEGLPNKNATKEKDAALSIKDINSGDTKALKALQNEDKAEMSNYDTVVKPKKNNRRGYTGKFAIAHMLHQGDLDTDKDNVESRSKNEKLHEEIGEMNPANEVKSENKDLTNKRNQGNNEKSNSMVNDANEKHGKTAVSDEDKYMDLVLESQAVEKRMKHRTGVETMNKNRPERKVSFSSDEIVTEDSESDSSSDIESDLEGDQKDLHSYSHSQKASAYEDNTYFEGKARQKLKTHHNRNSRNSDNKGARRKEELQNEQIEFEEYWNYEEDYPHDKKQSYDPHAQYNQDFPGYPFGFSQQSPTRHSQRESGIHPTHPLPPFPSMPGYPYAFYPDHRYQCHPGNFYNQWYRPFAQPLQGYPMQYSPYSYLTPPGYGAYPMPYASKRESNKSGYRLSESEEENMKEAFELQTDYIRLMCQKGDRGGKEKKKHSKRMS